MSIIDSNVRNAASRQKRAILGEATVAQLPVVACVDDFAEETAGNAVGGALKAVFGGSMETTGLQIFVFQAGDYTQVYVQPYDGMYSLPGEHHIWIPGAWNVPTLYKHDTWGSGWETGGDEQLGGFLKDNPALKAALDDTSWEWKLGSGEFKYPWSLQTRPVTNGYTHVAMKGTGEQDVFTHQAGVAQFQHIVGALLPLLGQNPGVMETGFHHPVSFDELYAQIATGALDPRNGVPETAAVDHGQTVYGWLSPHAAKKLIIGNPSPKQDGNIRRLILPPFAQAWPIVAAVDLTMMGSAKEALVFTPTHVFVREEGAPAFFQYSDIRYVEPTIDDDTVWLWVDCIGQLGLPCGKFAQQIHATLTAIASTRPA